MFYDEGCRGSTIVTMKEKKILGKDWKEIHQAPQEWLCFCPTWAHRVGIPVSWTKTRERAGAAGVEWSPVARV